MTQGHQKTSAHRLITGSLNLNILLAFCFGVVFIATMLLFAIEFPNPSPFQFNVFIVVLALAAGGAGSVLPGTLNVEFGGTPVVRAGGALAMFALVLVFRPAIVQTAVQFKEPPAPSEPVALSYLALFDAGNVQAAWDGLDPEAKGVVVADEAMLKQLYDATRKPLGTAASRVLIGSSGAVSPPNTPIGLYRALSYRTKFADECRNEIVLLRATQDLQWRPFSYQISLAPISCT